MAKVSQSELKAALSAILARERLSETSTPRKPKDTRLASSRRNLRKRLNSEFTVAGLDTARIGKILAQDHKQVRRQIKAREVAANKNVARPKDYYRYELNNRKRALEHITGSPLTITPIVIGTPLSIFANPSGMLTDFNIQNGNSWAKINHTDTSAPYSWPPSLKFFFGWKNQSDYKAVINAKSDLLIRGICEAAAVSGVVLDSASSLTLDVGFKIYMGSFWIQGPSRQLLSLSPEAWDPFGLGTWEDKESKSLDTVEHVSLSNILVDDNQLVIFQVSLTATYWTDGGWISVDFATQNRSVTCPSLVVELLTPPAGASYAGANIADTVARRKKKSVPPTAGRRRKPKATR